MRVLHEMSFLANDLVEVELHDDLAYRLAFGDKVVYEKDGRRINGKKQPYRFRSVEQLRYDFEQDVIAAGGRLA